MKILVEQQNFSQPKIPKFASPVLNCMHVPLSHFELPHIFHLFRKVKILLMLNKIMEKFHTMENVKLCFSCTLFCPCLNSCLKMELPRQIRCNLHGQNTELWARPVLPRFHSLVKQMPSMHQILSLLLTTFNAQNLVKLRPFWLKFRSPHCKKYLDQMQKKCGADTTAKVIYTYSTKNLNFFGRYKKIAIFLKITYQKPIII